jgi:hypothetical protein
MGRFTPIAGAETALTREFGKHVFEIAKLLRVAHNLVEFGWHSRPAGLLSFPWPSIGLTASPPSSAKLRCHRLVFGLLFWSGKTVGERRFRMIEISFPDQTAAQATELVRELRQALLRDGAKPEGISLGRSDPQAMSHADYLQIALNTWQSVEPIAHNVGIALTAFHVAQLACEVCLPARAGIRIKTPAGKEFWLSAGEIDATKLEKILSALTSDEQHG